VLHGIAWFLSLVYILLKGSVVNDLVPLFFDVDLVIVITASLLIRSGSRGAAIFAFGQGMLIDLLSAGFLGLFALLYVISLLCLELGARFFDLRSTEGQFLLVGLVVFAKGFVLVGLLDVFAFEVALSTSLFFCFGASAFFTGLIAPLVFSILRTVQNRTAANTDETA
jgi:rod shape-determining protein MreD